MSRCPRCTSVADPPPSRLIASRAPNETISRASSASSSRGDARPAAVAADREQLAVTDAERAARVAPDGDVGVELRRPGGEPLLVGLVDHRASVPYEKRTRLDEIPRRIGAELAAPRKPDGPVNVDAGPG